MILGFASDHRGFKLKKELMEYFSKEYDITDCGTFDENSCDYPDYAYKLGQMIVNKEVNYGIAICGSGIGISIALNKIKGVYCAKVSNVEEAKVTRFDNDTNCVAFGESMSLSDAIEIVDTFINTEFSNLNKHKRRIEKVKLIEKDEYNA